MKKVTVSFIALILVILAALSGCSNEKAKNASTGSTKGVKQEITVNLGGEPYTLDPAFASDTTSFWVINHLYEGLYAHDKNGKLVNGAASKVDVSKDGKTYTFTIRKGGKWSDGKPVTAKDFEYAWKRVLNPKTAAYDPSSLYYIKGAEEYNKGKGKLEDVGIQTKGDDTLVVELKQPIAFFKEVLLNQAFLPVNQSAVEGKKNWAADAKGIVTNGPYTVSNWKHNSELSLEKSKTYWDAKQISMKTINFKMVAEATTYYQMFKSKQLDLIQTLPIDALEQEKGKAEFKTSPSFSVYTYTFNVKEKPFNNAKIRRAFALAVDREAIVKSVSKGGEKPAYGYVPYGVKAPSGKDFRDEAKKYYSYDPKEAKKLLKAGLKEEGWSKLPAVTLKYSTAENHKKIAEALQEMFKTNLNADVKLENQEWKTYIDTFKQKNFQAARMGWVGDFLDAYPVLNLYNTNSSSNFTNWSNPKFDAVMEKSLTEQNEEKRFQLLHEAEGILLKDMPIIPIYFSANNVLVNKNIKGIRYDVLTNPDLRWAKKVSE